MLIGGAENIRSNISMLNDLNVFPVPDGDTGTNMTRTFEGGIAQICEDKEISVSSVIEKFAHGMLLGARGNSGVILSQIFAGICEYLSKSDSVNAQALAAAYRSGIEKSYASVINPTEGTILTVFRESTEYAAKNITSSSSIDDFYKLHIEEAVRSLERTKELLPVLAEADVVDSGAAGYLCIAMGMYAALSGTIDTSLYKLENIASGAEKTDIDRFTRYSALDFGYCTEFLIRLTVNKVDPDSFNEQEVINALTALKAESIVCFKTGDIIKVHAHTYTPGEILNACQAYGEFLTVKIENMSLGHTEEKAKKKERKKISIISVAHGDGISSLMRELGADGVISGGQSANPSAEEFIEAFEKYDAEDIIVLPNNKNIHLAAKQAAELYTNARVHIVPTSTVMGGYAALSVYTPGISEVSSLMDSLSNAANGAVASEITEAVRDVTIGEKEIKNGDFISITNGSITSVEKTAEDALISMISSLDDIDDYEILTVFTGEAVDADRRVALTERLEEEFPELDLTVYEGGQAVYDYFLSLE